ncbi:glycosyltransferase [soil metagenome]
MKVLHFNASLKGGAAIAAQRIFHAVLPLVPDMHFYSLENSKAPHYHSMPAFRAEMGASGYWNRLMWSLFYRKLANATAGKLAQYEKFTPAELPINTPMPFEHGRPDLIHMHWTSEMIDFPSFFGSVPDDIPVIWTCHDMNPFTGGCHYTWGCERFAKQCHNCPQLATDKHHDLSTQTQKVKIDALRDKQVHVVANSKWIEQEARRSAIFAQAKSIQTIHYPLDTDLFVPLDKAAAKQILGLPVDSKVISFGAERFDNERKGFRLLAEALEPVYKEVPQLQCLVFGAGNWQQTGAVMPPMRFMGFVESGWLQRIIYSASDVFVIPSQQEAFGQTALEAMACGTAVVGFDTGGITDIINPGENGLLVPNGNQTALAQAITSLLQNHTLRHSMELSARAFAAENFNTQRQGQLYYELYQRALKNK